MTSNGNRKRKPSSGQRSNNSSRSRQSSSTNKKRTNTKSRSTASKKNDTQEFDYVKLLIYIGIFAVLVLMFLFALGIFEGGLGLFITNFVKGVFGFNAFVIPIVGIITVIYYIFTETTKKTVFNIVSAVIFVTSIGLFAHLRYKAISAVTYSEAVGIYYHEGKGGGVLFGSLAYLIDITCGRALIWILAIILIIASIAVMFGRYIVRLIGMMIEKYSDLEDDDDTEDIEYTKREIRKLREKQQEKKKRLSYKITDDEDDKKDEKKESGEKEIVVNPSELRSIFDKEPEKEEVVKEVEKEKKESNDIHQIDIKNLKNKTNDDEIRPINVYTGNSVVSRTVTSSVTETKPVVEISEPDENPISPMITENSVKMLETVKNPSSEASVDPVLDALKDKPKKSNKPYKFPPVSLLKKGDRSSKGHNDDIYETANKLKDTLMTFGVEVSIDPANCSKGPAVTRYELTPAPGVKVSRIVSLSDDIKLSLGAADIRIEAPIPGKSAVGIEVPNSESSAVPFRDLIESQDFSSSKSKLAFAVGKDLAGQAVIADIAKMPHLLIAGATGSGKSVCINTIIMSILYKAHPDDVKLILIDPKVVELSVYNGIPHLLLPVVTDPKKASASLHWGVSEMEDRYKKFADEGVRDLKGYNEKMAENPEGKKLPQVVIIVDELADLMMVAGKEVEESICRLAQLARAAGIHPIIATQRPSVDVITGLIKANMPSRIAFSVSSGIDSRTILDTNGAEKLLGKGDMLFFPQGMNKPSRVQGCFVSDNEVLDVVDFIKNQGIEGYDERIMQSVSTNGGSMTVAAPGGDLDDLFGQAGLFIIGKEKASIGALQRAFKIGFNRAARIMDQLEAKGVVGPEEGTKPRKILMSEAEFTDMMNAQ